MHNVIYMIVSSRVTSLGAEEMAQLVGKVLARWAWEPESHLQNPHNKPNMAVFSCKGNTGDPETGQS